MKNTKIKFIVYCLALVLIATLIVAMVACSSKSTSTSTQTSKGALTLKSISVEPASPDALAIGATLQFNAKGNYSDGSTTDITSKVTWTNTDKTVATIDSSGLATTVAGGNTIITADLSGVNTAVLLGVIGVQSAGGLPPGGPPGGAPSGGAPPTGMPPQ